MKNLLSVFYYRILLMNNNELDWVMESIRILPAIQELKSLVTCPKELGIIEHMITYLDDDYTLWDFDNREVDKEKRDKNIRQLVVSFDEFTNA